MLLYLRHFQIWEGGEGEGEGGISWPLAAESARGKKKEEVTHLLRAFIAWALVLYEDRRGETNLKNSGYW